eukprot:TRINITY_DN54463_c0_g1_i1.p1 TRINITY_DN54463_c0_g1~~TRINITY_DN54463_c0_g1_i1.p1  ORF type:complete len:565 (-),score=72.52 TRINITY_DN54463_c0_g1_i1:48-1712(-)
MSTTAVPHRHFAVTGRTTRDPRFELVTRHIHGGTSLPFSALDSYFAPRPPSKRSTIRDGQTLPILKPAPPGVRQINPADVSSAAPLPEGENGTGATDWRQEITDKLERLRHDRFLWEDFQKHVADIERARRPYKVQNIIRRNIMTASVPHVDQVAQKRTHLLHEREHEMEIGTRARELLVDQFEKSRLRINLEEARQQQAAWRRDAEVQCQIRLLKESWLVILSVRRLAIGCFEALQLSRVQKWEQMLEGLTRRTWFHWRHFVLLQRNKRIYDRHMRTLRRHLPGMVQAWRLRMRQISIQRIQRFLKDYHNANVVVRAVKKVIVSVVTLQRCWRRHAEQLAARVRLLEVQWVKYEASLLLKLEEERREELRRLNDEGDAVDPTRRGTVAPGTGIRQRSRRRRRSQAEEADSTIQSMVRKLNLAVALPSVSPATRRELLQNWAHKEHRRYAALKSVYDQAFTEFRRRRGELALVAAAKRSVRTFLTEPAPGTADPDLDELMREVSLVPPVPPFIRILVPMPELQAMVSEGLRRAEEERVSRIRASALARQASIIP